MTDEQIVTAMLSAAGISPSEEETAALITVYPTVKGMVDTIYAVDAARYENMCLTFQAEAVFADWA
jgi:hypothetical protein